MYLFKKPPLVIFFECGRSPTTELIWKCINDQPLSCLPFLHGKTGTCQWQKPAFLNLKELLH